MEERRFDRLTRAMATRSGRRSILKTLAAGVVATVMGTRNVSAAPVKPAGKRCHDNAQCATGYCDPATRQCIEACNLGNDCGFLEPCASGCSCYCDPFVSNPDGSVRRFCLQDPPDPPTCEGLVICLDSHDECPRGTICTASSACGADSVCLPLCA